MRTWWRTMIQAVLARVWHWRSVVLLSLLGGVASLLGLAGGRWWGFDLCAHFQAQYFVFQLLCLYGLVSARRFRWTLLPTLLLVMPGWHLAPYYLPSGDGPPLRHPLRVLSFNVLCSNTRYTDTVRWVQATNPDIAFFPEITPLWEQGLAPLKATMPHCLLQAQQHNFGFAVFSKHPIVDHAMVPSALVGVAMVQLTLEIDGRRLIFVGVHPPSPLSASYSHGRDAAFHDLAKRLRDETRPVIVAGDFNATPWSHAMRPLQAVGLRDTMLGRGFSATWKRAIPLVAIPIDLILSGGPLRCHVRHTGPNLGSDHRPVVADLSW